MLVVDTAWTMTRPPRSSTGSSRRSTCRSLAVVTHAHQDKMGGMDALHAAGLRLMPMRCRTSLPAERISCGATQLTFAANGWVEPATAPNFLARSGILPRPRHTSDNITVGIDGTDIALVAA